MYPFKDFQIYDAKKDSQGKQGIIDKLKRTTARAYTRFIKIRGNPKEIALGFSLGIFIGLTPTMGIQLPIALFAASLLKWNKIAALTGVWITNPVSAPFIYGTTYLVGSRIIGVEKAFKIPGVLDFELLKRTLEKAPEILFCMTIGGIIIGIPLALISYYLSFSVVKRYQDKLKIRLERQKEKLRQKKDDFIRKRREKKKTCRKTRKKK
ncbi:MAG: DUF2062 domain-containing protein [Desulfobacterales bacterium]|jgi:hypothetical protein